MIDNLREPYQLRPSVCGPDHARMLYTHGMVCPSPSSARIRPDTLPELVTFVNPARYKGAYPFVRMAKELGRRRPDIPLLVVESREIGKTLGACGLRTEDHPNATDGVGSMAYAPVGHGRDADERWTGRKPTNGRTGNRADGNKTEPDTHFARRTQNPRLRPRPRHLSSPCAARKSMFLDDAHDICDELNILTRTSLTGASRATST